MGRDKPGKPRTPGPQPYNPLTGLFGSIIMAGWVSDHPRDGKDLAYAYLGTPGDGATGATPAEVMPAMAGVLGLNPRPGTMTENPTAGTYVDFTPDGWARITFPNGEAVQNPMNELWRRAAQTRGQILLALTYLPFMPGEDTEAHNDRTMKSGQFSLGIIPVH